MSLIIAPLASDGPALAKVTVYNDVEPDRTTVVLLILATDKLAVGLMLVCTLVWLLARLLSVCPAPGETLAVLVTNPLNVVGKALNTNTTVAFSGNVSVALTPLAEDVTDVAVPPPKPVTSTGPKIPMPCATSVSVAPVAALGPKLATVTV